MSEASHHVALVKNYLRARRAREQFFGPGLFADPAWDILLDLYLRDLTGRSTSITSASIAAQVSIATGLRSIWRLERHGHVVRIADVRDKRRAFLRLTAPAREALENWVEGYLCPNIDMFTDDRTNTDQSYPIIARI